MPKHEPHASSAMPNHDKHANCPSATKTAKDQAISVVSSAVPNSAQIALRAPLWVLRVLNEARGLLPARLGGSRCELWGLRPEGKVQNNK